jgi:hypothetical protein
MRWRLPLLVLLYVTLDFANPLMPGAVRFEGGRIEVVQADRSARIGAAIVPAPETRPIVALPVAEVRLRPAPVAAMLSRSPRHVARRVTPPRRPAPPSSATEDH